MWNTLTVCGKESTFMYVQLLKVAEPIQRMPMSWNEGHKMFKAPE